MKSTNARTSVNGLMVLILFLACLFIVSHAARASGVEKSPLEDAHGLVSPARLTAVPRGVQDLAQATTNLEQVVPVSITDEGFFPDTVTVTVGTVVEWTNNIQETVSLVPPRQPWRRAQSSSQPNLPLLPPVPLIQQQGMVTIVRKDSAPGTRLLMEN